MEREPRYTFDRSRFSHFVMLSGDNLTTMAVTLLGFVQAITLAVLALVARRYSNHRQEYRGLCDRVDTIEESAPPTAHEFAAAIEEMHRQTQAVNKILRGHGRTERQQLLQSAEREAEGLLQQPAEAPARYQNRGGVLRRSRSN